MMIAKEAKYTYVKNAADLQKLTERTAASHRTAVDTEADSLHHYYEKACLIQLTQGDENFILDPLAGLDLSGFLEVLAGRDLIFHGADYDLRLLRADYGFSPRAEVFDTMIAARILGYERLGLAALAEDFLGVTLNKGGQKFDWSRRPLPEDKILYAANDTRFLERLADRLGEMLRERGREEWLRESCQSLVLETGRPRPEREPDRAWRIKGLKDFNREELALVRAIWGWREEEARKADLPPFKVLSNQPLLNLARLLCRQPRLTLPGGVKLPRTCRGERLDKLIAAVEEARSLPPEMRPRAPERKPSSPSVPGENERFEKFRAIAAQKAHALQIPPSVLAPQAALRSIARENPADLAGVMAAGRLTAWQARILAAGMGIELRV